MSGAGSTFGGFMAGLPQDVKDLTKGITDIFVVIMHFAHLGNVNCIYTLVLKFT